MNRGLFATMLATSFVVASPAWALFNVQALGGSRSAKFSQSGSASDTIKGDELRLAAHLDPIPLVPVAFGLALSQTTFDSSQKMGSSKFDGLDVDLEVEAWLPLQLAGLVPYAKLSYTVAGAYKLELNPTGGYNPKVLYKPSGLALHVGVKYEFLLRLGVMAEFEMGTRTLAFDKVEDNGGLAVSGGKDIDQNSTSILIGLQAGI